MRADAFLLPSWLFVAPLAGACESGTGGRPVLFDMELGATPTDPATFITSSGWTVSLDEACVAVGPIYLHANPPHLSAGVRAPGFLTRVADWLVPSAHAHDGDEHFAGGEIRGEWVGQEVLNPFGAELRLQDMNGLAGPFRSFSVILDPPIDHLAEDACLRGHHAYAAGTAVRGDVAVDFEGGLDIEAEAGKRRVEGLAGVGELDDGAIITVRVDLANWFDQADFSLLEETAPSGRRLITPTSQVTSAWFIGARDAHSFSLEVGPPPAEDSP